MAEMRLFGNGLSKEDDGDNKTGITLAKSTHLPVYKRVKWPFYSLP